MDLNEITAVATAVAAIAAWATVATSFMTVRESKKLMSHELFLNLFAQYDSEYMQWKRGALSQRLLRHPDTTDIDDSVLVFFETVGFMTNRSVLDKEIVWNTFSYDILHYWLATSHYVYYVRDAFKDNTMFVEFEKMRERLQVMYPSDSQVTKESDSTINFLRWETQRLSHVRGSTQEASNGFRMSLRSEKRLQRPVMTKSYSR